jgi:hypothetical protein
MVRNAVNPAAMASSRAALHLRGILLHQPIDGVLKKSSKRGVPLTIDMSCLSRSVHGVSCLPGAQPGGCANLCDGSCSCRDPDPVLGATVAMLLRVCPSCTPVPRPPSPSTMMSHMGVLVSIFRLGEELIRRCAESHVVRVGG